MTDELTRERIEKVKKNVCISLDSLADENGEVAKSHKDDLNTIIAALDAVRWRDAETEPPEANATVLVRWKAENGVQGYNFSYFEDGNWYGNSGYKIIEWLPLPIVW
jgi:hypothetical protein